MDLRQLRSFVRVAELSSFSRAAAFLKIAQPALSRQIRALEEEFHEPLFVRTGRGVKTTGAGERLLDHARGILRQVDRLVEDMEHARTGKLGRVTVGMPATLSVIVATALIRQLRIEMPDARYTLLHGRSTQLQEWVMGGSLDMALVFDAPSTPLLERFDVSSDNLGLVGTKDLVGTDAPVALRELAELPIIIQASPNRVRAIVDGALADQGLAMDVVLESDSHVTAFHMAREGMGCTVHSLRFQNYLPMPHNMVFRKIVEPEILMKSQVILPARRPISPLRDRAAEIFLNVCREQMALAS